MTDQLLDPVGLTVIISGPAGSGKSTLMAQAYRSGTNPVWLSIHSTDNDPAVLWSAVTDAIAPVIDGFGSSYRHLLRGPQPNVVKGIVPAAINELAQAEQPLTIFIDDVQLLENQECLASLETFVQQRPESITIVIAGRESPPLRLQRERLRGHLVEIRQG
ncbi:MAG: AAA family ATPase, partial [Actinomycetia bacterium]|nr:AAA family ATPase [Actinomycetes bacterium]MCP5032642.1 AAA family ATPase [Actinomycetes bacterium]